LNRKQVLAALVLATALVLWMLIKIAV